MAVPVLILSAVKMSGSAAGTTTWRNTCERVAPSERTDRTDAAGICRAASRAVTSIWKKTMSAMSAILGAPPIPSNTSSTGRKTIFGTG